MKVSQGHKSRSASPSVTNEGEWGEVWIYDVASLGKTDILDKIVKIVKKEWTDVQY